MFENLDTEVWKPEKPSSEYINRTIDDYNQFTFK
jgi:hypothetical protein